MLSIFFRRRAPDLVIVCYKIVHCRYNRLRLGYPLIRRDLGEEAMSILGLRRVVSVRVPWHPIVCDWGHGRLRARRYRALCRRGRAASARPSSSRSATGNAFGPRPARRPDARHSAAAVRLP